MCDVVFIILYARPWALGRKRFIVGPLSAKADFTISVFSSKPKLFFAFAVAERKTLIIGAQEAYGINSNNVNASAYVFPCISLNLLLLVEALGILARLMYDSRPKPHNPLFFFEQL